MFSIRLFILTLALSAAAFGQRFNHPLSSFGGDARKAPRQASFPDTVRVLAVMVQFQRDNDQAKDGNGQFVLSPPAAPFLDSPPRDSAYFAGHLAFLSGYFQRVSKGKTIARWTLLNTVYTLPGVMYDYAPHPGESNQRLANLARDTWRAVDSSGGVADFSKYDCFVLFHAGVGHDIDLVSSLGFDPTPHNIPSIFLGPNAFRQLLGGPVTVKGGTIANTIIMPETETRTIQGVSGPVQLTFGINGLLCASLGSYLGLPDLFNTASGASGIGRFGLMDGQSIFSFSGAFPPEPSAWEKYWLGWVTPIRVPAGTSVLSVPAVALADTIYRIPISDAEYFLLENRSRDPHRTGVTVTSVLNGAIRQQHHARDTAGFAFDDISALTGTITDVDVPDWSLPGGVDPDGTFYDGGILIWHIDEGVINNNISANAVNADSSHRGVNLEEADGSQDIGRTYDITSPGLGSETGTALDYWYSGNPSPVNKNEFSATTFPGSRSNLGALSHVAVNNFSARAPRMTARVIRGDAVAPVPGYPRQLGEVLNWNVNVVDAVSGPDFLVGTSGNPLPRSTTEGQVFPPANVAKLYLLPPDSTGHVAPFQISGLIARSTLPQAAPPSAAASADLNADGLADIVSVSVGDTGFQPVGFVRAYSQRNPTADSLAALLWERPFIANPFAAPVISDSLIAVAGSLVTSNSSGTVSLFRFDGTLADSIPPSNLSYVVGISRWRGPNSFIVRYNDGRVLLTVRTSSGGRSQPDIVNVLGGVNFNSPAVTGLFGPDSVRGRVLSAFTTSSGLLYLVDSTLTPVAGFPVSVGGGGFPPVLADIDGDGVRDIVLCAGGKILAYNVSGASLDNFPISIPQVTGLSGPVVGDVDGDGNVEIVAISTGGVAYAFNKFGKLAPGFPLAVGSGSYQSAALMTRNGAIILGTASADGSFSAWITGHYTGSPDPRLYPWPQYGRDSRHSGLDLTPLSGGTPLASGFFPPDRAYNWPNPVYDGRTNFRYYVKDNASVTIRIFDLAGDLVTTLNGQATGGIDNEIPWDVSHIQSGIYFARIEASSGASSAFKIVKVAVVK